MARIKVDLEIILGVLLADTNQQRHEAQKPPLDVKVVGVEQDEFNPYVLVLLVEGSDVPACDNVMAVATTTTHRSATAVVRINTVEFVPLEPSDGTLRI